jgi:hypothetical protein
VYGNFVMKVAGEKRRPGRSFPEVESPLIRKVRE